MSQPRHERLTPDVSFRIRRRAPLGTLAGLGPAAAPTGQPAPRHGQLLRPCDGVEGRCLVDYAASLALDSLFITDLDAFESLDEAPLQALRQ